MLKKGKISFELVCLGAAVCILTSLVLAARGPARNQLKPAQVFSAGAEAAVQNLPPPSQLLDTSRIYSQPVLKGIKINPADPFKFEFIIDTQDKDKISEEELSTLIKYFLAALTTPEEDLWVNLSPYEKDRVIPDDLSLTDLGKDLLGEDYILKQLVSSLTYPESSIGKRYWDKVYEEVYQLAGTTKIPINTFNKVWIIPDSAEVYENGNVALITEAKLKAMHEEDYLALKNSSQPLTIKQQSKKGINKVASKVMKEIVLPEIEWDVNHGENFTNLRQIYNSFILAVWFKQKMKESIFQYYIDQGKIEGIDLEDKKAKEKIYNLYLEAYKNGVYNYIKKDYDEFSRRFIRRSYYSGGIELAKFGDIGLSIKKDLPLSPENYIRGNSVFGTYIEVKPVLEGRGIPVTKTVHKRNKHRLRKILREVAKSKSNDLAENAAENEIMEFIIKELLSEELAEKKEDKDGNFIIKIKKNAQKYKLWQIVMKWVISPREGMGAKAASFQSSMSGQWGGRWIIVGMEDALSDSRILEHEQREIFHRQQNPNKSWIYAHNKAVEELGHGVFIDKAVQDIQDAGTGELGMIFGWFGEKGGGKEKRISGGVQDLHTLKNGDDIIVETDMTLDYGGLGKWNLSRIFIDLVQNHKPGDAKGSKIEVNFYLKKGGSVSLHNSRMYELQPEEVDYIEIADDGIGYDHEHLKYFLTTKGSAEEGGKFGEGLKIATAAAVAQGMSLEFRSRKWRAKPLVVQKTLNKGHPNEIKTANIVFKIATNGSKIKGARTIIHNPSQAVLETAKQLPNLVISLRKKYQPLTRIAGVGAIVERSQAKTGTIYVKGNRVLTLPNSDAGIYYRSLFNYDIFDDSKINRDRDMIPQSVVSETIEALLLNAATPEIAKTLIENSAKEAQERASSGREDKFYENALYIYSSTLEDTNPVVLDIWKKTFYKMFGKDALIATFNSSGEPTEATKQAIAKGRKVVDLTGTVVDILSHSGIQTTSSFYFEKEIEVDTGIALDYREAAWNFNRILLDAVQNHLPADSGGTQTKVEFSLKSDESEWLDMSQISQFNDEEIATVRISDDGNGYDYRLLGMLHSTKKSTREAGEWGEGIKMLSAAALRHGLGLELRSRNWQAQAYTEKRLFQDADQEHIQVETLSYKMVHLRWEEIKGSQTIFTNLTPEFITLVRQLPQKVIFFKQNYKPVSITSVGEIFSVDEPNVFVQGIEVQDVANNHHVLLGYNFLGVEGFMPSPDRNVLHTGKLNQAIGVMMSQTDSVEALTVVLNNALDPRTEYIEFQDVTKLSSFSNQTIWQKAWKNVLGQRNWNPEKIVLTTQQTAFDADAIILLRNMGYTIVPMNKNIAPIVHSLGVHYDHEVLHPKFEYVDIDNLSPKEIKILSLRKIIDNRLEQITGKTIDPGPIEIFSAAKSSLTGEELSGWNGYWDGGKIGIFRGSLKTPFDFGKVYLEEMGHRLSQAGDYTREFTNFFRNSLLVQIFQEQGLPVGEGAVAANNTGNPNSKNAASSSVGGIDLDPANLNLRSTGVGLQFNLPLETIRQFQASSGLTFKILKIESDIDLDNMLGIAKKKLSYLP